LGRVEAYEEARASEYILDTVRLGRKKVRKNTKIKKKEDRNDLKDDNRMTNLQGLGPETRQGRSPTHLILVLETWTEQQDLRQEPAWGQRTSGV
jgi:hypothetical protein